MRSSPPSGSHLSLSPEHLGGPRPPRCFCRLSPQGGPRMGPALSPPSPCCMCLRIGRGREWSCRAKPCEGSVAPTIRPALPVASQPAIDRLCQWPAGSIRREGATRHPRTTHALGWLLGRSGGLASSRPAGGGNRVQWPFLRSSACGTLKIWHQNLKLQRATSNGSDGDSGYCSILMKDTGHNVWWMDVL